LSTGGTPSAVAGLLSSFADLINAFNGSDGGKAILQKVADKIGGINGGLFIQQAVELSKAPGGQIALLAQLGNSTEAETVNMMVEDSLSGNRQLNENLKKVIAILRDKYNTATGAEKELALKHLNNALTVASAGAKAVNTAIIKPFEDKKGKLVTPDGKPITAKYITTAIMEVAEANPSRVAKIKSRN
jgi:hypothetical protein